MNKIKLFIFSVFSLVGINLFALSDENKELYRVCVGVHPAHPAVRNYCNRMMYHRFAIQALPYKKETKEQLLKINTLYLQSAQAFLDDYYSWEERNATLQGISTVVEECGLDDVLEQIAADALLQPLIANAQALGVSDEIIHGLLNQFKLGQLDAEGVYAALIELIESAEQAQNQ